MKTPQKNKDIGKLNWSNFCATNESREHCHPDNCLLFPICKIKKLTNHSQQKSRGDDASVYSNKNKLVRIKASIPNEAICKPKTLSADKNIQERKILTGNSMNTDCRGCGRILRGSKEVNHCETCMIQRELSRKETLAFVREVLKEEFEEWLKYDDMYDTYSSILNRLKSKFEEK